MQKVTGQDEIFDGSNERVSGTAFVVSMGVMPLAICTWFLSHFKLP